MALYGSIREGRVAGVRLSSIQVLEDEAVKLKRWAMEDFERLCAAITDIVGF